MTTSGKAAVGGGGVGVVLHGEAEVAGRGLVGLDQDVFAGAHQLDDGQREVRESGRGPSASGRGGSR